MAGRQREKSLFEITWHVLAMTSVHLVWLDGMKIKLEDEAGWGLDDDM